MIPSGGAMLASYLNTMLRDRYDCLEQLCEDKELDLDEIKERLAASGFRYEEAENRIVAM